MNTPSTYPDHSWDSLILQHALVRTAGRRADLRGDLGIPLQILSKRLDAFIRAGLMDATPGPGAGDDPLYALTDKGRELEPILTALDRWKQRWDGPPVRSPLLENADLVVAQRALPPELAGEEPAGAAQLSAQMSMLGTFSVRLAGQEQDPLPKSSQRLLAYLALNDRAVGRATVAATIWPDVTEFRAAVSLRSALSRLAGMREVVLTSSSGLRLAAPVGVDTRDAHALARRLLRPGACPPSPISAPRPSRRCRASCSPTGTTSGCSPQPRTGAGHG